MPDFTRNAQSTLAGLIATSTNASQADKSLRFYNVNGTGPWAVSSPGDQNDWAYSAATKFYLNGKSNSGATTLVSGWNILGGYRTNQTPFPTSFRCSHLCSQ